MVSVNIFQSKKGLSLIGVIFATGIIAVVLIGFVSVVIRSIQLNRVSSLKLKAVLLAQESITHIENIIATNVENDRSWDTGMPSVCDGTDANRCVVAWDTSCLNGSGVFTCGDGGTLPQFITGVPPQAKILYGPSACENYSGYLQFNATPADTCAVSKQSLFSRQVFTNKFGDKMNVTIEVSWNSANPNSTFELSRTLFNLQ